MPHRTKSTSGHAQTGIPPQPGGRLPLLPVSVPECGKIEVHSTLAECMHLRRSVREFTTAPVTLEQVSRLLWATQGVTGIGGLRTSPSAGAVYPLSVHVAAANVKGLPAGFYRYDVDCHELAFVEKGERRKRLAGAAMGQDAVEMAPVAFLITSYNKRAEAEFGAHAAKLIAMEVGHAGQNFLLQAVALGLGAIGMAKIDPTAMRAVWPYRSDEEPHYVLLAGHTATRG